MTARVCTPLSGGIIADNRPPPQEVTVKSNDTGRQSRLLTFHRMVTTVRQIMYAGSEIEKGGLL
jgi:hypothetical protein